MSFVGQGITRTDGRAKVTGAAKYSAEIAVPHLVYAVMVTSTKPNGRLASIDAAAAAAAPGVLTVLTHTNAPRIAPQAKGGPDRILPVLQDDLVRYDRQPIALVVADTFERATHAAALVRATYAVDGPARYHFKDATETVVPPKRGTDDLQGHRGDADAAFASAPITVDNVYTLPTEHHNPMEPHATVAVWAGDALTVYDATQGVSGVQKRLATSFGIPTQNVRVIAKYIGGGFGSKGTPWAHVVLAAMAAKAVGKPVKLVLTRPQMWSSVGYRPRLEQRVALGADANGKLRASIHEVTMQTSTFDDFIEPSATQTSMLYASPTLRIAHTLKRIDTATPTYMRAPGESSGTFALESAMDELAYATGLDPIELRMRNYAETDPKDGKPWSSKSLRACYEIGAERFGWANRPAKPRSLRRGNELLGIGMATAVYPTHRGAASAIAKLHADGSALVQCGTVDIGTGSYTVFRQVAADAIGSEYAQTTFDLGDTEMPHSPGSGGSQTAASVGSAVKAAGLALRAKLVAFAVADPASPLHGIDADRIDAAHGKLYVRGTPGRGETFAAIMARHPMPALVATGDAAPGEEAKQYAMYAFGAQFAEVRVDPDFGTVRLSRMLGVFGAGKILNAKTGRSQFLGGMVWGASMALHEHTRYDERTARIMNANLGEYLVPVNADIPAAFDAIWVDEVDEHVNPVGVKGIGEIGITGAAAAIANAVFHATGKRVRDLPISPEKLLS
jgi:xanthine dehydrogenase YagR molybdenum-binding subunit